MMGFWDRFFRAATPAAKAAEPAGAADALSDAEISAIEASFAKVEPIAATAATLFYTRLFEIAPQTRPLFKGDPGSPEMDAQGAKLMATLGVVVKGLRNMDALTPVAADLARRHVGYGVKAEHYQPVGAALLWTLGQGLGEDFTPELSAAWAKAYGALSSAMVAAAYGDA